jgi:predicted phosphodiesterase
MAEIEIHGRKIAVNHFPHIARPLALAGVYDAVFYGHDHTAGKELAGKTLLLNPGEVMGRFGTSTFASYDPGTGLAEIIEIP